MNKSKEILKQNIKTIFKIRLKNQLISNIDIKLIDSFIGYKSVDGYSDSLEPKKPISCAELIFKISFNWKGFLDNNLKKSIIKSTFNSITLNTSSNVYIKNLVFDKFISFDLIFNRQLDKLNLKDGIIVDEDLIWQ